MYQGGKYLGYDPIKLKDGTIIKTGEIVESMPEAEAKGRIDFEPFYGNKQESKPAKKTEKQKVEKDDTDE